MGRLGTSMPGSSIAQRCDREFRFSRHILNGGANGASGDILGFSILQHTRRNPTEDAQGWEIASDNRVCRHHTPVSDDAAAQDRRLGSDPNIRPDANWRLGYALILDRPIDVLSDMIEIADVYPIRDDRRGTDFNVQVTIHGVVSTEDAFIADSHRSFVTAEPIVIADMHPPAKDDAAIVGPNAKAHVPPQKNHARRDDVAMADTKQEISPVPHQVPR